MIDWKELLLLGAAIFAAGVVTGAVLGTKAWAYVLDRYIKKLEDINAR